MIILDTNVISELVKPASVSDRRVYAWAAALQIDSVATTSVSFAECLAGFRVHGDVPDITRKQRLFEQIIGKLCDGRILPFDAAAAHAYAELIRERRFAGKPISRTDAQIAAIARVQQATIATRDRDFADCGVTTINPWEYAGP